MFLLRTFYTLFNTRAVRRAVAEHYATNVLGFRMTSQDAVSHLLAIPSCKMLRSIILSSFQDFIGAAVA